MIFSRRLWVARRWQRGLPLRRRIREMSNIAAFELAERPKEIEINPVTIHILSLIHI